MSTRDIIEASKHGPELALAVIFTSTLLGGLNYFEKITSLQTTLFFFPLAVSAWYFIGRILRHAPRVNTWWLMVARQVQIETKLEARNLIKEVGHAHFSLQLSLTNTGHRDISSYRMLLWIPNGLLPQGTTFYLEDKARSTARTMCLRAPYLGTKVVEPILDGQSQNIIVELVMREGDVTPDFLSDKIIASVFVDGLNVYHVSRSIGDFVTTENIQSLKIKALKAN